MSSLAVTTPLCVRERYAGLLYASFAADSLALGAHWIYDQAEIAERFGRPEDLHEPATEYHPGKARGAQTHYGDQALVLLESIQASGDTFVLEDFARRWQDFWGHATAYRDHATKDTLAQMEQGGNLLNAGSSSDELGGAGRIAPLLVALRGGEQPAIIAAVRAQTALTHTAPEVVDAAEFLARMVFMLVQEVTVAHALEMASALTYRVLRPQDYLRQAQATSHLSLADAVEQIGQSCPLRKALPAVFAILLRHGDDLETALVENVAAGGDSAARGLVLGLLLGCAHGVRAIPARWLDSLLARPQLDSFLKSSGLGEFADAGR